jgi:hypothetical protein
MEHPDIIEVQRYLGGIDYPADRETMIEHAREQHAPGAVIAALEAIDDRTYDAPSAVSAQISHT